MNASPTNKLACLDGLRGLAVLAVVLFHHRLESESFPVRSELYTLLAPSRLGYLGVHLFLVLSGFCLTHSLIGRARKGRSPSLARYFRDRWWRIAPPYYAAIAVYLIVATIQRSWGLSPVRPEAVDARQIGVHLAFLHGLWPETLEAINSPFWSLSLEFQFYLTLPLLFALAERVGYRAVVAAVVGLSLIFRAGIVGVVPEQLGVLNGFFLGRWAEFALGMAVASWANRRERGPAWLDAKAWPVMLAGSLTFLVVGAGLALTGWVIPVDPILGVGFALLLLSAILSADEGRPLGRWLSWRPLTALGTVSYSIYLTHSLVLASLDRTYSRHFGTRAGLGSDCLLLIVNVASVFAVGWLFFRVVESRFARSIDTKSAAVPAAQLPQPAHAAKVAQLCG